MTIGGYNEKKHLSGEEPKIIPYFTRQPQYTVNIYGASLGDMDTGLKFSDFDYGQGSFFDSGTTLVFCHQTIYKFSLFSYSSALTNAFIQKCNEVSECRRYLTGNKCVEFNTGFCLG